jgi:hypothetical protein
LSISASIARRSASGAADAEAVSWSMYRHGTPLGELDISQQGKDPGKMPFACARIGAKQTSTVRFKQN